MRSQLGLCCNTQENVIFPRRQFGISVIVNNSFQVTWFDRCKLFHNDAEMILKIHSVLYVAKLSKMVRLGQAFAKCRRKFSIWSTWLSCMKEFAGCISRSARKSAGNLQTWTRSTALTSETILQRCLQELATNFFIHSAIKMLSKLSVFGTAIFEVWKVLDQSLVFPTMNTSFREVFFSTKAGKNFLAYNYDTRTIKRFDDFACSQRTS